MSSVSLGSISIDELSQEFTASAVYTSTGDTPDTCTLTVNYFNSKSAYDSSTVVGVFTDTDSSLATDGSDYTASFAVPYDEFSPTFSELFEDGMYSFTFIFLDGSTSLGTINAEWFNDYEVRLKIVQNDINLADQLESNNAKKNDYYVAETLATLLDSANYCSSSSLQSKAMNILDKIKVAVKYW